MSHTQCYEWFKNFKEGRTSVSEDPRPGRPCTSTDDRSVERVREMISWNSRLTVRGVAEEIGISVGSCHAILTAKLQMHRVSAKFVSLLTDGQKENWVSISQDMFANADADENFLKNRLGSSWLFLFPTLKTILKGHRSQDIEEVKENATRQLRAIKQNAFQEAFQKQKKHWKCCNGCMVVPNKPIVFYIIRV